MICISKKYLALAFLLIAILLTGVIFFNLNNSQNINSKAAGSICGSAGGSCFLSSCPSGYIQISINTCPTSKYRCCKKISPSPTRIPTIWPTPQLTGIPTPQVSGIPTPTPTPPPPMGCYYKLICPTPTLAGPTIWPTPQVTGIPTPTPTAKIGI